MFNFDALRTFRQSIDLHYCLFCFCCFTEHQKCLCSESAAEPLTEAQTECDDWEDVLMSHLTLTNTATASAHFCFRDVFYFSTFTLRLFKSKLLVVFCFLPFIKLQHLYMIVNGPNLYQAFHLSRCFKVLYFTYTASLQWEKYTK